MLTEIQMLILFTCFTLGAILRTVWGYLWKYLETGELDWDNRYTATMIISIIVAFIFSITTFSTLDFPTEWTPMLAFAFITLGFTTNALINSPVSLVIKREKA